MAEEVLRYPGDYLLILLAILAVAVVIQFCLRKRPRLRWLLPILSALLLVGAEGFWLAGGWNREEVTALLTGVKVTPYLSPPPYDETRGVLLRLDDRHVLAARHYAAPYIYEHTGPLEDFTGGKPKWRVFGYPALYGELRAAANEAHG